MDPVLRSFIEAPDAFEEAEGQNGRSIHRFTRSDAPATLAIGGKPSDCYFFRVNTFG